MENKIKLSGKMMEIHMEKTKIEYVPFIDDMEKIRDMLFLSKEEWLESYSYMTEEEWNITAAKIIEILNSADR